MYNLRYRMRFWSVLNAGGQGQSDCIQLQHIIYLLLFCGYLIHLNIIVSIHTQAKAAAGHATVAPRAGMTARGAGPLRALPAELAALAEAADMPSISGLDYEAMTRRAPAAPAAPSFKMPDIALPKSMPSVKLPENVPSVKLPDISAIKMPDVKLPDVSAVKLPESLSAVELPDVKLSLPDVTLPDVKLEIPDVKIEIPDLGIDTSSTLQVGCEGLEFHDVMHSCLLCPCVST